MRVFVTGAAGFIGSHVVTRLLGEGEQVIGVDDLNDYYDPALKHARLEQFAAAPGYVDIRADISDTGAVAAIFEKHRPERVVHLAAQAGVRYSITNPHAYISSNLVGFANILEGCRACTIEHLVYASSSSVYGANTKVPFSVHDAVDHPISLYAATKKAGELMAHTYSSLYGMPATGLRFFTVYGPWGRPDMSPILFARSITAGTPINVFNYGKHTRDFTYIDDIVEGVVRVLRKVPEPNPAWSSSAPDPATSRAPYRLYNIGSDRPVALMKYIEVLAQALGTPAKLTMCPPQPGDVADTWADVSDLVRDVGYKPVTPLEAGIPKFVEWFRKYYKL